MRVGLGLASVLLCGLAACGGESDDMTAPESGGATTVAPIEERCDSGVPSDAAVTTTMLEDGDVRLFAASFGTPEGVEASETVMVLLHQTGTLGLCGWGRFAREAAAAGVPSVAVDMCGYGGSECAAGETTPPAQQVDLAATYAREDLGADRVVLVGASMGGSQTVIAVAEGADVDAWVDLSGPSVWQGTTLADLADAIESRALPSLVVHAPDDGPEEFAAARALARATGSEFLEGESGHGYELLTISMGGLRPDGERLLRFVGGPE